MYKKTYIHKDTYLETSTGLKGYVRNVYANNYINLIVDSPTKGANFLHSDNTITKQIPFSVVTKIENISINPEDCNVTFDGSINAICVEYHESENFEKKTKPEELKPVQVITYEDIDEEFIDKITKLEKKVSGVKDYKDLTKQVDITITYSNGMKISHSYVDEVNKKDINYIKNVEKLQDKVYE